MMTLSVREARAALGHLDELVRAEGEVWITRHGQPVVRVLPMAPRRPMPSHSDLRNSLPRLVVSSEALVREDRDGR